MGGWEEKKKTWQYQLEGSVHGLHNTVVPTASRISRESWKRQGLELCAFAFFPGAF
jgi:hypothetical protein